MQNSDCQAEIAAVCIKTEGVVRFNRIESFVLQRVSFQLCQEPDATALLILIDHQTRSLVCDGRHCEFQLPSAIAAQRSENFSSEALGMNAQQRRLISQIASHQ